MHVSELNSTYHENNWKFVPSTAPVIKQADKVVYDNPQIPSNRQSVALWSKELGYNVLIPGIVDKPQSADIICGACHEPAAYHLTELSQFTCNRTEFTSPSDYLLWSNGTVSLLNDNSWTTTEFEELDENDYVSPTEEWEAIENWRDLDPTECTSILGANPQDHWVANELTSDKNAYVEGTDGFTSQYLIDPLLTQKHHEHLLNVYRDKQGFVRIGSVQLAFADDKVHARCVSCNLTTFTELSDDRDKQERFVWALIAHGNNHAAAWYRNRPEFYELSGSLSATKSPELTKEDQVEFLFEHQKYCKVNTCTCEDWLKKLAPIFAEAS